MTPKTDSQIEDWLKKLERESWQLELLVSAFTIFLLIGATVQFDEFLTDLIHSFNFNQNGLFVGMLFLLLLDQSLKALTIFLVAHLLLRGFWIGTIGLRSVQSSVDFEKLKYSDLFTEKLRKKVISLDQLVIRLDEICSVIFSFAFLVIFMLVAFGMYMIMLGVLGFFISTIGNLTPESWDIPLAIFAVTVSVLLLISGIIYLIDYFTLGFFKKFKWFSKIYYPVYWFYSYVTLAILSRSIYYYMISKFSKKKIRVVFSLGIVSISLIGLFDFDHFPYFPEETNRRSLVTDRYDELRSPKTPIQTVSIESRHLDLPYLQVFIRYSPTDNSILELQCPDFEPKKEEGINPKFRFQSKDGNVHISGTDYTQDEFDEMLNCLSAIYQLSVNDSVYTDLSFHFYIHPDHEQQGILATIPGANFTTGENMLEIRKKSFTDSIANFEEFAHVPFWYTK